MARTRTATMTLEGGDVLDARLKKLHEVVATQLLVDAALRGAEVVRAAASERAPVRTGFLKAHIGVQVVEADREHADVAVAPERKAFYGIFVERGTATMRARPYLRPALDENKEASIEAMAQILRATLRGVAPG